MLCAHVLRVLARATSTDDHTAHATEALARRARTGEKEQVLGRLPTLAQIISNAASPQHSAAHDCLPCVYFQAGATGAVAIDGEQYSVWTFGLPFAETAANGDVLLGYYAPPAELAKGESQMDFMVQRLVV